MSSSSMDTSLIRRIADELRQTSEDVCRALDASPEAQAFLTQRCDGPAASPSTAEEPTAKVGIRGRKFIVLYVLSEDGEDGGGRPLIYADTSLDRVQPYFAASTNNTGHRTTTAHHRSLRACVFVRWRNDLMSFSISSVDVAHPLEDLQFTLHMYEQLLRQEWEPTSQVVSRMQELGDELDVVQHIPPKVDLRRYIYPDILQLCEDFPAMEVHQLMEQLGHLAKDSTYMEAVRKCRKPCVSVLRASHDIDRSEVAETELMLEVEPLKLRRVEEVGNRFRSVSAWIKDVQAQLESREWILANKIVLETDFRSDFIHTGDKMLKIIRYVESIPVKGLRTVTSLAELEVLAKNIFTAVVHPPMIAKDIGPMAVIHSAIKPPLMREVLMCSTSEIVVVFMRITEGRCVELLEALHPATNAAPQRSAAASYDAVVTVLAFLSSCVDFLHGMRENYMKHLLSKSDIPDVSCHPLLEALCQRSNMLETMVERHYRILAQLENAFAAKIELPKKDELPTERVKKAKMPTRGSGFQHEVDLVREECSSILHRSCAALVKAICSPPEHVSAPCISSSRRTVLWRTYAAAQEYVDASCATYAKGIEEADEFIVHHLKKILATEPGPSPGSLANASHGAEQVMRLFFIYSRFRFMDLPNLRELMTSLGIPATEAIIDRINAVVNDFTEGKHRSHDIRYAVEAYRVSAYVAHMLREHGLLQSLRQCLFWRDCVMDMGWHNLMSLRRANNVWRLDDKLMEYFHLRDTPLAELMNHPRDVVGTVFALSYLHRQYPEEPWRADAHLHIAQQYIANYDGIRSLTDYAEECLTGLGVFQRAQRAEKNQKLSVQRVHEYILRSLSDLTTKWCIQSSTQLRECGAMGGSGVLSTPVLRLQPRIGSSARGGEVSGATELVVEVSFPWQLEAISNDVQYMSSVYTFKKKDVLDEDVVSTLAQINESVRQNGGKARIAHTLRKLLAIYYATVDGEDDVLVLLTSDEYRRANHIILSGCNIHWNEDTQIFHFAVQLEESIRHLTHAVAIIRQKTSVIYRKLQELSSRPFHPDAIALWVGQIHAMVSGLAMDSRSATRWMRQTQPLLDAALMQQLKYLLHGWTMDFISLRGDPRYLQHTSTGTSQFHLLPLHVRMCLVYREVQLKPAAPEWRRHWLKHLNASFSWLHEQPPLELGQAAQAAILSNGTAGTRDDDDDGHGGHYYLLEQLPPEALAEPLRAIESCIQDAQAVEQQWRQSQQFLHMDPSIMQRRFGQNLRQWSDALQLMHQLIHRVMDVTEPNILLGGIAILAEDAQGSLRGKLDQVSSSMHGKFKDVLEAQLETSLKQLLADKSTADGLNVIGDTADACKFLCIATRLRNNLIAKEEEIMLMSSAESSLLQLGYVFPDNWVRTATLREEFMAYKDAIDRKSKALQVRRPYVEESARKRGEELHAKVAHLRERLRKVHGSGETQASVHGGEASGRGSVVDQQQIISIHDEACTVDEEAKEVVALQEALDMQRFDASEVEELKRDASDLLEVWAHVANLTSALHTLGATPLFEAVPRHVQEELKRLEKMAEAAPEPIQLNPIFVDAVAKVKAATSCRRLLQDLRSDAMASLERSRRHWVALKQQLQSKWVLEDLTLQHIWDSDPTAHAAIYASILEQAHGEHRLEVQLQAITSFWSAFEFSTTVYKQRVALLRGWDVVFERLEDDLSTFSGMRASPFFTSQQVVAMTNDSEAQLNRLRQVLEVLMETQKRWVYLDGVFAGNREIRSQLPRDASQFDRTSIELVGLMPQLRADGTLPEVKTNAFLDDPKMLSTLERLVNQLNGVQRALTSYLDTQRRKFPRFFFVGDDDLLEIMGNSRDPHVMGRHLKKMFSALANFMLPTEAVDGADVQIHGFSSADGECVRFSNNKVVWVGQRPMYDWLKEVEQLMATSLRTETLRATEALTANKRVSLDWLGTFPSQTLALALQLWWVRQQEEAFSVKTKDAIFHAPRMSFAQRERLRTSSGATPPTSAVIAAMEEVLTTLASSVLDARLASLVRHRCEQAITVAVYQRDCSRWLVRAAVQSKNDFEWARVLRLYTTTTTTTSSSSSSSSSAEDALVECRMADATVVHGFEYIGGYERLVQTPLTDKCYLTLMQALHARLGGSPVGPAGTGKTETVKALGMQLGRHVLIFNCDDTFDFQAVSRIFLGLCQVGAWGCFDEFNRLEERILSALSQQIQTIQESLRGGSTQVELSRQSVPLHTNVAVFITMNPGYAGRSNLPSNLKQLFRTITMAVPDRAIIAEVMLFAQGFHRAEALSKKMVPLFRLCEDQFSRQAHYDFGLRALKSVLIAAGDRKRAAVSELRQQTCTKEVNAEVEREAECTWVLESLIANIAPKLITHDLALFYPLLHDFFPDRDLPTMEMAELRAAIAHVCSTSGLTAASAWVEKICQLSHTRGTRHGIMLVGPSGTGKTMAWRTLMAAMVRVHPFMEVQAFVLEPKVLSKAHLFGSLDITTREWQDGVFTAILRRIIVEQEAMKAGAKEEVEASAEDTIVLESSSGGADALRSANHLVPTLVKEYWIIFDGDVDPEWVENLNSVLDDNKVLTLPNGERLALPRSVRIFFEVQNLRYATPATVSRCGMLWFSEGVVPLPSMLSYAYRQMERKPVADHRGRHLPWHVDDAMIGSTQTKGWRSGPAANSGVVVSCAFSKPYNQYIVSSTLPLHGSGAHEAGELAITPEMMSADLPRADGGLVASGSYALEGHPDALRLQREMMKEWDKAFERQGIIARGIQILARPSYTAACIMEFGVGQQLQSILSLLWEGIWSCFRAEQQAKTRHSAATLTAVAQHVMEYAVFWGLGAPMGHEHRRQLAMDLQLQPHVAGKPATMLEVEVSYTTGQWSFLRERLETSSITAEQVGANDTVIGTVDTMIHEALLSAWLSAGRSAILCGPPGSGKTMSVSAVLHHSPAYDAVFLNFSSGTTVEMVIKALEQYCSLRNTAKGLVLSPTSGKRLLLFCDEINLPAMDRYGTQTVLQLLRQIIERGGFYRTKDNAWVQTEMIQVVGACNPPTDAGRVPISLRVLRWAPVLFVDFPTDESLHIIYSTYCRAVLSFNEKLCRESADPLASAMVAIYRASQTRFTPLIQPHYLYSPRELSRWSRALHEAMMSWDDAERKSLDAAALVRLALHEGLRVFSDRLVSHEERAWADGVMDAAFREYFPALGPQVYARPLLYASLLSPAYRDCAREDLRRLLESRLPNFCDEEVSTPLVVFDAMVDHVVRIDRVLRQPLGHVLLAGSSGVGKTVMARLVAWLNGFSVFWLKAHRDYDLDDFAADLRGLLRRSGCKRERICFVFDESNIIEPSFLEYMNALLASGEVPGLFDGEEWAKLMLDVREAITGVPLANAGTGGGSGGAPAASPTSQSIDLSSDHDVYRWFLRNVREYLHVVFTINPASTEFSSRAVASPALFNRCTIDWCGDWDESTLRQITHLLTPHLVLLPSCREFASEEVAHAAVEQTVAAIHMSTLHMNADVRARSANVGTFITPRHFSDCVHHLRQLYEERQSGSVEQLRHLNNGLAKLGSTAAEVAAQQTSLTEARASMAERSAAAESMLERIISETDTTKKEKAEAENMRVQLQDEQERIAVDSAAVQAELAQAEPALRAAEAALNTVKPEYLREIRAYTTPPPTVKRVLESVVLLMGEKNCEWDILKSHIRREDFLSSVKAFKPTSIHESARAKVAGLLQDASLTVETANFASKAAGPLLQWVQAQLKFCAVFQSVAPMRAKNDQLAREHHTKEEQLHATEKEIGEKEAFLQQLKAEYQTTTEEIAELKHRITVVSGRCTRATTILTQLLDEQSRWESEIASFDADVSTAVGDCLVSAAFLAYAGFFDEQTRHGRLIPRWLECIRAGGITPPRPSFTVTDFLAPPAPRLQWQQCGLPKDRVCIENVAILRRCTQRYTFLVDPDGTAASFLQRFYAAEKISKASFSRPGYLKQLEMACRFGYPIIMEDAELLDQALAPLLNREFRHVGSRSIVRIGAHEIDLSNTFRLFLITRRSTFQPPPDLAGQVCILNFTVTISSLQSQCLQRVLLHERPDIDLRRTHLLNLQGAFHVKLRALEQDLLTSIAESEGSLLDNDQLIQTLTKLKHDAHAIQQDIQHSDESMRSILVVEERYRPVAFAASHIFFALRQLSELSCFYHFNVRFMFVALRDVMEMLPPKTMSAASAEVQPGGDGDGITSMAVVEEDPAEVAVEMQRLTLLFRGLFALVHGRVIRGVFQRDHLVLALRLAQLRSATCEACDGLRTICPIASSEWEWLISGFSAGGGVLMDDATSEQTSSLPSVLSHASFALSAQSRTALTGMFARPEYAEIVASMKNKEHAAMWSDLLLSSSPLEKMQKLPDTCFPPHATPCRREFLLVVMLYFVRRDLFVAAAFALLHRFFDGDVGAVNEANPTSMPPFFDDATQDLERIMAELNSSTPLIMISEANYDPSTRVEQLARHIGFQLNVVAMGSGESVQTADVFLQDAMRSGGWVLLKNAHLARDYVEKMEKAIHFHELEGSLHHHFRFFISAERGAHDATCVLPISLLEISVVVVYEMPPGMQSSLLQTYAAMPTSSNNNSSSMDAGVCLPGSSPCQRLLLSAAWAHAAIVERLTYVPMGWAQMYEFSDTEFSRVAQAVLAWSSSKWLQSSSSTAPEVAWDALRAIIATTIYGGKVSNDYDQRVLDLLCEDLLSPELFSDAFSFLRDASTTTTTSIAALPTTASGDRAAYLQWLRRLPDGSSDPQWIGLPSGVSRMVHARRALDSVERLAMIQSSLTECSWTSSTKHNDDRHNYDDDDDDDDDDAGSARWLIAIRELCAAWGPLLRSQQTSLLQNAFVAQVQALREAEHTGELMGAAPADHHHREVGGAGEPVAPLVLALQREVVVLLNLLEHVVKDVALLQDISSSTRKPTAASRALVNDVSTGRVPSTWAALIPSEQCGSSTRTRMLVGSWLAEVRQRSTHLRQLAEAAEAGVLHNTAINLGLLFAPGAYLTASKQQHARQSRLSLESLCPTISLTSATHQHAATTTGGGGSLLLTGIVLFGARLSAKGDVCELIAPTGSGEPEALSSTVGLRLTWEQKSANHGSATNTAHVLEVPLYATSDREVLLERVELPVAAEATKRTWYVRGVCLAAWAAEE